MTSVGPGRGRGSTGQATRRPSLVRCLPERRCRRWCLGKLVHYRTPVRLIQVCVSANTHPSLSYAPPFASCFSPLPLLLPPRRPCPSCLAFTHLFAPLSFRMRNKVGQIGSGTASSKLSNRVMTYKKCTITQKVEKTYCNLTSRNRE